ncbi:hypothetical protein AALP_AA7G098700 [Arabis alpina]|uniref:Uncharacterized protein n=1 Tax=Arabis alpina TaxID=50452 RepID=A0A087GH20_ARAAL|nr:hypothetical protein AALP_AA7G098700 [Arabis alpina]
MIWKLDRRRRILTVQQKNRDQSDFAHQKDLGVKGKFPVWRLSSWWISVTVMEFFFFDLDRVLRGGGYLY